MTVTLADQTLSLLVHADSKVGKTTLAATAPKPLLILDAEGGSKFLPHRKVTWDPKTQAPPEVDGTWEICVVMVRDFDTMRQVFDWLQSGQHPFVSVVIDSITEVQRRCKQNLVGTEQMKMQDWGALLTRMDALIRGYRDLTLHPHRPLTTAVFIAETRQENGKWRPYMQGQIGIALPYWMDVVGYLYVSPVADANGQETGKVRRLLVETHPLFEAGERVQGRLGTFVEDPNIVTMLKAIYPAPGANGDKSESEKT